MLIKIDTRETEFLKKCQELVTTNLKYKDIQIISETLPLGDIIINDGQNDCIIIERKTLADLASSIQDGRYEEQSYRLNGLQHHNHNIIYLIEGDMYRFNAFKGRIDKQTLYSAMFSINYFKGFSLMRSTSLDETAQICCNMVYKLVSNSKLNKFGFYSNNSKVETGLKQVVETPEGDNVEQEPTQIQSQSDKDYCNVIKKVKKESITKANIGEIMLCQIPGVSSASALAILQQFKTLPNLIQNIKDDANCLNTVSTVDAKGKSRKISKTTIATIVEYLKE